MSVGEESLGANTMLETSKLYLAQEDGGLATTLAAGSAPGESGVSVLSVRFHRARISARRCDDTLSAFVAGAH